VDDNQEILTQKLLRLACHLPQQRYEIFQRLYVHGQSAELVREDMRMSADHFEEERRGLLRSFICA